jgi:hypothetical protein
VRLLAVHSRLGRTITRITVTDRTPTTGPAVTASGTVTPGYLPASHEPQCQKSDTGFIGSSQSCRWRATSSCPLRCGQIYLFNRRRVIRVSLRAIHSRSNRGE